MALADYLWLIKLIIEILRTIAGMSKEDRISMAKLRQESEDLTS